ncbi:hypothetical protein CU097_006436 [Rhizopus azygosporus]|uniref:Protein-S-isoprenylcysteine O-methyltransferase n=1 Tax=Rhizopus azygosporus TaxID=86630 RepID=A0A367JGL3_RHIAZ|nr:hypothetical protein CU097_006436 [Rhizopus azygosporus]
MNQDESGRLRVERVLHDRRPKRSDRIEIFDGRHTAQNISAYGFLLGLVCGGGLLYSFYGQIPQLGIFLVALPIFHFLEYVATALFNAEKLSLDSYLINHGRQYHAAHTAALVEFIIEYYFFPNWKQFGYLSYFGLFLLVIGQGCRTIAMFSAKHNFSHHIVDHKENDHVLVTHGIYKIMRHPSYFGFFWWALGAQLLLGNPICFIGFIFVLQRFFSERITYEEYTLERFFGQEWRDYKSKTPTLMLFV